MTLSYRPANTTLVLLASLYCAQGLPSGLVAHSLPVLLRQNGVDLAVVQAVLGHASLSSTTVYVSAAPEHLRASLANQPGYMRPLGADVA